MSGEYCSNCGGTLYGDHDRCSDCREASTDRRSPERGPEPTGRLAAVLIGAAVLFALSIVSSFLLGPLLSLAGALSRAPEVVTIVGVFGLSILVMLVSGGLAGFLRGSDLRESALTGGLAGFVGSIPSALLTTALFLFVGAFFGTAPSGSEVSPAAFVAVAAGIVLFQVGVPTVGCAIGGALGSRVTDRRAPEG